MADRPRGPRGPRGDRPDGDRPQRPDRRRGSPDWKPRGPGGRSSGGPPPGRQPYRGPAGDRPRPDFGDRPRRDFEDRPRRDFGDRPQRDFGDRPRRDFGDRSRGDFDDRSRRFDGPRDERPRYERPRDERPREFKPRFDRPRRDFGPRPVRSFDTRRPRITPAAPDSEFLGEDEELIAGKRPVEEAFAARREAIRLLIVPERRAALDALAIHATTLRIPVVEVEGGSLTALAGFDGHQGVALVAKPRAQADVASILAHARERDTAPFILVLDSLEDPQNFGTLLRSAEACGVDGVIYPTRRAAPLSPAAIKASAGATEHLLLAPVEDLAGTLADLHGDGLRIVAADEDASLSYSEADLRGPIALVVGSEGRGISGPVRRRIDLALRIPMHGRIASLNAAVAGSILLFAAAQQRPHEAKVQESTDKPEPSDSADAAAAEAKPRRKAPAKKAEPKPKAERKAKAEPKAAKSVAKPRRLTIRQVSESEADELLPG